MRNYFCKNIIVTAITIMLLTGCGIKNEAKKINLSIREDAVQTNAAKENSIKIAVGSRITSKEGYVYYIQLLNYIGKKLGQPVKFIDKDKYSEINLMLKNRQVDVAFVCSQPYAIGKKEFNLELLAVPVVKGKKTYKANIIVHADSKIKIFGDLKGKTFAFTDPESFTGKTIPTYMLAQINEIPDKYFKNTVFTYAHDKSIELVAAKLIDGAAVDGLIWDHLNKTNPEITAKTRIIAESRSFGIPPVVVPPGLDKELKNKLKKIFLGMDKDEEGKKILENMMIDKFIEGDDMDYNGVREIIMKIKDK